MEGQRRSATATHLLSNTNAIADQLRRSLSESRKRRKIGLTAGLEVKVGDAAAGISLTKNGTDMTKIVLKESSEG